MDRAMTMEPIAKTTEIRGVVMPTPMNPGFTGRLNACRTNEDLFYLCKDVSGYVEPDAFAEIRARGLLGAYEDWLLANTTRVQTGYMCRAGKHCWPGQAAAVRCCDGLHTLLKDPEQDLYRWVRVEVRSMDASTGLSVNSNGHECTDR